MTRGGKQGGIGSIDRDPLYDRHSVASTTRRDLLAIARGLKEQDRHRSEIENQQSCRHRASVVCRRIPYRHNAKKPIYAYPKVNHATRCIPCGHPGSAARQRLGDAPSQFNPPPLLHLSGRSGAHSFLAGDRGRTAKLCGLQ